MNLHGIVSGAIGAVNPLLSATLKVSAGYGTAPDGTRTPAYTTAPIRVQSQPLSTGDLAKIEGLNIQGVQRAMYLSGDAEAVVRVQDKGGDLIALGDGSTWKVTAVLEKWPDWVKVAVTLQNGG